MGMELVVRCYQLVTNTLKQSPHLHPHTHAGKGVSCGLLASGGSGSTQEPMQLPKGRPQKLVSHNYLPQLQ